MFSQHPTHSSRYHSIKIYHETFNGNLIHARFPCVLHDVVHVGNHLRALFSRERIKTHCTFAVYLKNVITSSKNLIGKSVSDYKFNHAHLRIQQKTEYGPSSRKLILRYDAFFSGFFLPS